MRTQRPCEACKKTECPNPCYPLNDWQKSLRKAPCKGCQERTPGCHGSCEDYIAWKAALEELKQIARIDSQGERDARNLRIEKQVKKQKYWRNHK